jgi:hypothetical protein
MRYILTLLIVISSIYGQTPLPSVYHTVDEIHDEIFSLQAQYPDIVKVDSIGVTNTENLPIYSIKLSDNAAIDEDEPAVLFAGQCHAEEVLGVEVTMWMINEILLKRNIAPYKYWLQEIEIYFVVTYNPEGLNVVTEGLDLSFRKNKTDNNGNGVFDFVVGQGNDFDGVDLNRNYGFNWIHGDSLDHDGGNELHDYYRGAAPFSEGGTKAIYNLAEKNHFVYSINWHSSRTGNLSEKVFYSFNHEEKLAPDFEFNKMIGESVAGLIITESGATTYEPSPSRGRKGSAHDWFYQKHRTTQLLIECGTSNLQPDSATVIGTNERCSVGAYDLLNRTIGYQADAPMLKGKVVDSVTNEPLEALYYVEERWAPYLEPIKTDPVYGSFYRQIAPGDYHITFKKDGYFSKTVNKIVNGSMPTNLDVSLDPKGESTLHMSFKDQDTPLNGSLMILGDFPRVYEIENGSLDIVEYEGDLKFIIDCEGYIPVIEEMSLSSGSNYYLNYQLSQNENLFVEDFNSPLDDWNNDGFYLKGVEDRSVISTNMDLFYGVNSDKSLVSPTISLSDQETIILRLNHRYYTEHSKDIISLKVVHSGGEEVLFEKSGISNGFINEYFDLSNFRGEDIKLKFGFTSDITLVDPGWQIDRVEIFGGVFTDLDENLPKVNKLYQNYPNPFNPTTTIKFDLERRSLVTLNIFNSKGEKVYSVVSNFNKGTNSFNFDGTTLSSGVYYYQLTLGSEIFNSKMVLIK